MSPLRPVLRLVVVLAALLAAARAADGAAFRPVAERQPLEVGAPPDAFPYSFVNARGEWDGFSTEVVDAMARVMGLRLKRTAHPARELNERFLRGEFDFLQHFQQSPEREAYTEFTVPLLTLQGAVFVRRDGPVRRLEDLRGRDYAIYNINSLGERLITTRGIGARFVATESPSAALRLVDEGKCAGTFASQLTALSIMERDGLKRLVRLDENIEGFDVRHALAVHRGDSQLLARLNEGLAILRQSGEFDRIHRKWFGRFGGVIFTREEVVNYVAVMLALGCLVAGWALWRQRVLLRRIEQLNSGLEQRVAERTAELNAHVGQVEQLNRELEAFSYSVSHDLRAPLRNISGFIELLTPRLPADSDPEIRRFAGIITAESARLGELIDGLLLLSRVGRAELKREPVELGELVDRVRADLAAETAGRAIEWKIGAVPTLWGDPMLLRQVVENLLGNAVKFTRGRDPAVIEIGALPPGADGATAVFVRDNGAGFNPKYRDRLFGVFQRLHNARDFEGTGIGLANVQRIVARHGGRVWAEGNIDKGAVFYFTLGTPPAR